MILFKFGYSQNNNELSHALSLQYQKVDSLKSVDSLLVSQLLNLTNQEPIAEIGQPFEATDVIGDTSIPMRRFVTAGVDTSEKKYWILCYEHGGFGYHLHVAVFALKNNKFYKVTAGQALFQNDDILFSDIKNALDNGDVNYDNHW